LEQANGIAKMPKNETNLTPQPLCNTLSREIQYILFGKQSLTGRFLQHQVITCCFGSFFPFFVKGGRKNKRKQVKHHGVSPKITLALFANYQFTKRAKQ